MGFLDNLFDSDWRRRSDINENAERLRNIRRANRRNRSRDSKQDRRLEALEREVDQLEALLAGLVQVMVEKNVLADAEIQAVVAQVQASDASGHEDDDDDDGV